MRILIINLRIGTGSVGRIVSDLYHGVISNGNQCKVAYARGGIADIPVTDTYKICSDYEIKIHAGLTRLFGNTAFYFKGSTERFCKWIDEYDPDVIHIHGVYGYYLNMESLFSYFSKSRAVIVSTLHSCWDFTGHCCYFDFVGCEKWKSGCKKCINKSSYPKSSFIDNTKRNYVRKKACYDSLRNCIIVTPSDWLANIAKLSFLGNKDIRVINNGVDTEAFKKTDSLSNIVDRNIPSILCVANIWDQRKGWEDVKELANICGNNYQLIVVGLSKKQISELPPQTIAITRTESKDELAKLYSSVSVFFNPTYEDNYPTVNLEAASCQTPIVTYNTGGSPEVFNYGNWGIVINKRDYQELFEYASQVYFHKIRFDYTNVSMLSNEIMVKKYCELYNELIENDKNSNV